MLFPPLHRASLDRIFGELRIGPEPRQLRDVGSNAFPCVAPTALSRGGALPALPPIHGNHRFRPRSWVGVGFIAFVAVRECGNVAQPESGESTGGLVLYTAWRDQRLQQDLTQPRREFWRMVRSKKCGAGSSYPGRASSLPCPVFCGTAYLRCGWK